MKALSIILSFVAVFGLLTAIFLVMDPKELEKATQFAKVPQKLTDKKTEEERLKLECMVGAVQDKIQIKIFLEGLWEVWKKGMVATGIAAATFATAFLQEPSVLRL